MKAQTTTSPEHLLLNAQTVLLVDWPDESIPKALVELGLTVYGYSPEGYTWIKLVSGPLSNTSAGTLIPPQNKGETDFLLFQSLETPPLAVDIVCVYRPPVELAGILKSHALPLRANVLWLLRPAESPDEKWIVEQSGLTYVEHCDLAGLAQTLRRRKRS